MKYYQESVTSTSMEMMVCYFPSLLTVKLSNLQTPTPSSMMDYFAELDNLIAGPSAGDALVEWLASLPLGTVTDPIMW